MITINVKPNTAGSVGVTPNSSVRIRRAPATAAADRAANAGERARRCAAERFHVNRSLMVSGGGPPNDLALNIW